VVLRKNRRRPGGREKVAVFIRSFRSTAVTRVRYAVPNYRHERQQRDYADNTPTGPTEFRVPANKPDVPVRRPVGSTF